MPAQERQIVAWGSGPRFNQDMAAMAKVKPVSRGEADALIRLHYLGKWPAVNTDVIGLFLSDKLAGVCVFSYPPREIEKTLGGSVLELSRLYLLDDMPCNSETWFMSRCIKFVCAAHPNLDWLVSYADPSVGHTGTIYRAANWTYLGMTDAGRKSPRCDYVDPQTDKKYGRKSHVPVGVEVARVPRTRKHRFVYPLTKKAKQSLKGES